MGKHHLNFKPVLLILLALTSYACSATRPATLTQTANSSSQHQSPTPSSQQDILPQNNVQPEAAGQGDKTCEVKKSESLQNDDFDARVEEILAYMSEKEKKAAVKTNKKASKSLVHAKAEDDYTEMIGKNSTGDVEHARESISEDVVAMAEEPEKVSDNAVGETEIAVRYSRKLGLKLDGTENQQLLGAISKWFGSPYRMGGCSKGGVDCSCFVKSVYEDVYGIELTRTSRSMYSNATKVRKGELQEGDLIYFKIRGRRISHVGIYLGDNKFVHSSRSYGVVIDDLDKPYYKKRFVSGGRVGENVSYNDDGEVVKSKKKLR
jgi:cell wall-associated NlpC family hydrolase